MKSKFNIADIALIIVSLIWGSGFVIIQCALNANMPASLISMMRFSIGSLAVFAVFFKKVIKLTRAELRTGAITGSFLFIGFILQTIGQSLSSVSSTSFITATHVIIVPFLVWIYTKKKPSNKIFVLAPTTLIGIFILTYKPNSGLYSFDLGNLLVLFCAIFYALYIVFLGVKANTMDSARITFVQLSTCAILSGIMFLATDTSSLSIINWEIGLPSIVFLGIFSTFICFFLQTWAQTKVNPSKVAIILSMESVFGSIFSVLFGMDVFNYNLLFGGLIILSSIILTEIDFNPKLR